MAEQIVTRNGKRFVLVEERRWRRIRQLVDGAEIVDETPLPEYPPADKHGNRPAVEYARVSIARKIIEARKAAGLSQQEFARRAGLRQETISRLESGKHSPVIRTVERIDQALQAAMKRKVK